MNIQEMHNTFRTIGQQTGMQLIRGILPESIDVYLNDVIIEKTREELLKGVHNALEDSANTQASTMSPINTFRTLFRTARYSINTEDEISDTNKVCFYNDKNGYYIINIPTINSNIIIDAQESKINPMMFLGFSVEYDNTLRGSAIACRMMGSDVLETSLRDFCNNASKDYPIAILNGIENFNINNNEQLEIYTATKNCRIKFLNVKYIKVPNVVKYDDDINNCVNCDLPNYTHFDIVERAVVKFYASIGVGTSNQNTQQQT